MGNSTFFCSKFCSKWQIPQHDVKICVPWDTGGPAHWTCIWHLQWCGPRSILVIWATQYVLWRRRPDDDDECFNFYLRCAYIQDRISCITLRHFLYVCLYSILLNCHIKWCYWKIFHIKSLKRCTVKNVLVWAGSSHRCGSGIVSLWHALTLFE